MDKTVAKRYEIGRSTVWYWLSTGRLPPPHKIGNNTTHWKIEELDEFDGQNIEADKQNWIKQRLAEPRLGEEVA